MRCRGEDESTGELARRNLVRAAAAEAAAAGFAAIAAAGFAAA